MTRYVLKDKARQSQLDALSETNKFSDVLNREMCESFFKHLIGIQIHFGRLLEEHLHGGFVEKVYEYRAFIRKEEVEVLEDLKPGVWHKREEFDRNPNGYVLVEHKSDKTVASSNDRFYRTILSKNAVKFMYLEQPEKSNEQD